MGDDIGSGCVCFDFCRNAALHCWVCRKRRKTILKDNLLLITQLSSICCVGLRSVRRTSFSNKFSLKFSHPPYGFDIYLVKYQNHKEDGTNFCGLLRKAELYFNLFKLFFLQKKGSLCKVVSIQKLFFVKIFIKDCNF